MAVRNLTEVFILMRNNVIQTKHIVASNASEDRMNLITSSESDYSAVRMTPEWVDMTEEVQYEISRAQTKIKELRELQDRHVMRPTFDDEGGNKEESAIEEVTREITSVLNHCQRLVQHIQRNTEGGLTSNAVNALMQSLQQVTAELRTNQMQYLRRMQSREDSFQQYFEPFSNEPTSLMKSTAPNSFSTADYDVLYPATEDQNTEELTMRQLQLIEDNATTVQQREHEVLQITKSIFELNQLFKDLASFVVEQGTIIDRIDYNIEVSSVKVKAGLHSVKKAEQLQRKNRKMICIIILSVIIVVLLLILIIRKS